jgi:pilus assembly protein CpaC
MIMKKQIGNQSRCWVIAVMMLGLLLLGGSAERLLAAVPPAVLKVGVSEAISLQVGKIVKVAIADPAIADVAPLSENEISVIGKKAGMTTLTVVFANEKRTEIYRVEVNNNLVASTLRSLLKDSKIDVREVGDSVVLDGQVEDELEFQRAVQIAEACKVKVVNLLEIKKPRQISIRTRVAEVSSDATKNIGFQWFGTAGQVQYAMTFSGIDSALNQITHGFVQPKSSSDTQTTGSIGDKATPSVDVLLNLLIDNNCARLLSEPTLVTKSGSEASFLVGQEYPIIQVLPNSTTVEYKKIGVNMKIKPTADSKNRISTAIHAEVSQVTGILTTGNTQVPIIGTKTADTLLQVADGQTIVIGGLLENDLSRDEMRKVPWLADIPLFGYLFRNHAKSQTQREVLFFMTPTVVKDVNAETAGAARTPLMNQWSGNKATEKVLEIPKRDDPNNRFKGLFKDAPEEPTTPASAPIPPTTNFAPARPAGQ